MEKFVYHHPVKIIFGENSLDSLGSEVAVLGKRVLFVSGQSSLKKNGFHQRIVEELARHDLAVIELPGVQPNPLLSFVHHGIERAREHRCDVILAAGGGSVIDSAKAIAAGFHANHDVWKFFTGKKSVRSRLPLVAVPTVAGSGSEINHGMVLTNDNTQRKFGFGHRLLIPDVCIADPAVTCTVSPSQTAAGGVDILSHCLEPYLSTTTDAVPLQRGFLETISKTVVKTVPCCIERPSAVIDRSTMLWCSMAAMSGIGSAGLGKVSFSMHALEHGISALIGTAHGHGLASLLPGWLDYHKVQFAARLSDWGVSVFGIETVDTMETAGAVIDALRMFLKSIGCTTNLEEIGIAPRNFDALVDHASAQARIWRLADFTEESIRAVLDHCLRC